MGVTRRVTGKKPKIDTAPPALRALANRMLEIIKARCAQGLDIYDKPFASYDPEYARVVGSKVDLTVKKNAVLFKTLKATVQVSGPVATITIRPASGLAELAALLQLGAGHLPARPFLGLSPRDLVVLNRELPSILAKP